MNGAASTIGLIKPHPEVIPGGLLNFAAAMPSARVFGHPQPKMSWEDWSSGAEVPDISKYERVQATNIPVRVITRVSCVRDLLKAVNGWPINIVREAL
jgi:hypothetical protein